MSTKIELSPQVSTLKLGRLDRALGRLVKLDLDNAPGSQAETDLAGDTFHSLYRQPEAADPTPADRTVNRHLLDWVAGTSAWPKAVDACTGNLAVAQTTTRFMYEVLRSDEAIAEALQREAEAEQARDEAAAQTAAAEAMRQANLPGADAVQAKADAASAAAQAYVEKIAANPLNKALVANAVREAADKAQELATTMTGMGMGPGSGARVNVGEAQTFLARHSAKIAKIAKLAGRMRGVAFEARRQTTSHGVEPADIDFTQDIGRIFDHELALLSPAANPALRKLQIADYAETGLAGWQMVGSKDEAGPFVALIDGSGSMSGEREIMAKAVALGLAQAAKTSNRWYHLATFSSAHDAMIEVNSDATWQDHLTWAEGMQEGGTSFDAALKRAMTVLRAQGAPGGTTARNADMLLVTDGDGQVSETVRRDWQAFVDEHGCRLIVVQIGVGDQQDATLTRLADINFAFDELTEDAGRAVAQAAAVRP